MSSSLRLLTFDTRLHSWAMEVGASTGQAIPPIDTAEQRAAMIADAIVNSPFDYDMVGLCGVFDEDARSILHRKLSARFPYQVTLVDHDHVRVDNGTGSQLLLGLVGLWPLVGVAGHPGTAYRREDSGLMLLSRWPFATMRSAGLAADLRATLEVAGWPMPAILPVVDFLPFDDAGAVAGTVAGNEAEACKGVLYARVQRSPGQLCHVFFSGTCVRIDGDGEALHRGKRPNLPASIAQFMRTCTGEGLLPPTGQVVFMDNPDSSGEPAGGTLTAQHRMIDYALATVPAGHERVAYLSDHRPLRLDLALAHPHGTPQEALAVQFPLQPALPLFVDHEQSLVDGQVKWYRIEMAGTYDFLLVQPSARCAFEVYLASDLSRPRRPYRQEVHPEFGSKFVLASAPFLVKVFPLSRQGEQQFTLRLHRHEGRCPQDAIQLPYGVPVQATFPDRELPPNADLPVTLWNTPDTTWFRLDGPQKLLVRPVQVTLTLVATHGDAPFGVALVHEHGGTWTLLDRQGPGAAAHALSTRLEQGDVLYVQVLRVDGMTPRTCSVVVTAHANLSLLLGGQRGDPRLLCQQKAGGWVADDIKLGLAVDGVSLRFIEDDELGAFEPGTLSDLTQWLPDLVPYFDGVEFTVVALDDIGADANGRASLPPWEQLGKCDGFVASNKNEEGTVRGALLIDVADGRYAVQLSVSSWDERF